MKAYTSNKSGMADQCPFCNPSDAVFTGEYRAVIPNRYPYPRTKDHLLLIPHKHIKNYNQIEGANEFHQLLSEYLGKGYVMFGRQFPMADSSVEHLHIHLILQDSSC